jgi:hypothetical protein
MIEGMTFWNLFSGLLSSKRAMDAERIQKRSSREGYPLDAEQFARLDAVLQTGKRAAAIAAHREMSGSGPDGARNAVERRASELGVRLD